MHHDFKSEPVSDFMPVAKLQHVASACVIEPLAPGDKRHVDMSAGRGNRALRHMRVQLEDLAIDELSTRFVQIALAGHRGCGKSTELLALANDLRHLYTTIHMEADDQLRDDYDYTYTFLWLVEEILRRFTENLKLQLDQHLVEQVVDWFSEIVSESDESVRKELTFQTQAESGLKFDWFGLRLGLLAKLQSMIRGSHEERKLIRQTLQRHSSELVRRVNALLDHAHQILAQNGHPPRLLIVVDNLDRLRPHISEVLFFQNGDLLCSLRAHLIYTVPVPIALSNRNIRLVFPHTYMIPTVKVKLKDGSEHMAGIETLEKVVYARVTKGLFESEEPVKYLAKMSGGSVRDLVRMVADAALTARVNGQSQIDLSAAEEAVKQMRLDFEDLLIPHQIYFPLLSNIHHTKRDVFSVTSDLDAASIDFQRARFYQLLHDGVIFEYNGDSKWFDVHPAVLQIENFTGSPIVS